MNERYVVHGIPSNILHKDTRNLKAISVEDGALHITKVKTFIGISCIEYDIDDFMN